MPVSAFHAPSPARFALKLLRRFFCFLRREVVFCAAFFCAAVSAFFVPPSRAYFSYIDWNTLCILFALMAVVAALSSCGVFTTLGALLCRRLQSLGALSAVLVFLCFFFSMLITNDVALLTFVPFTIALLAPVADGKRVMAVVILQTVAANTGSMLTPLGNPQNLFLYQKLELPLWDFLAIMLPYTALSAALLAVALALIGRGGKEPISGDGLSKDAINEERVEKPLSLPPVRHIHRHSPHALNPACRIALYTGLFVFCLLAVFRLVPKPLAAALVAVSLLVLDRKILLKVDYMLLLTFGAFFVFTGNIAHIGPLRSLLEQAVGGHEFLAAAAVSQIISNVPATLLLYPFSAASRPLLVGVNAGGLGTLVASLASLISYKLYMAARQKSGAEAPESAAPAASVSQTSPTLAATASKASPVAVPPAFSDPLPSGSRYLAAFTLCNILFLAALAALYVFIG